MRSTAKADAVAATVIALARALMDQNLVPASALWETLGEVRRELMSRGASTRVLAAFDTLVDLIPPERQVPSYRLH